MDLQDEGKVRRIGVSNTYDVSTLDALGEERRVQVVQNRWYEGNRWDNAVCKYCRNHGIEYQLRATFSGNFAHLVDADIPPGHSGLYPVLRPFSLIPLW